MVDWFKSETVLFGLLVTLLPFLEQLLDTSYLQEYPQIISVIGVLIWFLRKGTTKELRMPFQKNPKKGRYL